MGVFVLSTTSRLHVHVLYICDCVDVLAVMDEAAI